MRQPRGRSRPRGRKYWPVVFEVRLRGNVFERAEQEVEALVAFDRARTNVFFMDWRAAPHDDEYIADVLMGESIWYKGILQFRVRVKGL